MTLDIVFCLNKGLLRPLVTVMNSIVSNSAAPGTLRFNIAVPPLPDQIDLFSRTIDAAFPDRPFEVRIRGAAHPAHVRDYMEARLGRPVEPHEGIALNYARFAVGELFDDIGRYVFLDGDIVVRDDIAGIMQDAAPESRLAAVRQAIPGLFYFRNPLNGLGYAAKTLRPFNAGVYVTDTRYWDEAFESELRGILDWDRRTGYRLFWLHTEPLMNLLFCDYQRLPKRWNQSGYGNHPLVARLLKKPLDDMAVIHWSGGHRKPWRDREVAYAEEWWAYDKGPVAT